MPQPTLTDYSTAELLRAIRRPPHDPIAREAVAELIRRYAPYVFSLTLRFCGGDRDRTEEAFQTAFLRFLEAWTTRGFADPIRSFPSLLLRMARNAAIDFARAAGKDALPGVPEEVYVDLERRMTVRALIEGLSATDREILFQTVVAGRTSDEAAGVMGMSSAAVRKRKARALSRLRALLAPEERLWKQLVAEPPGGRHR